MVEKAEMVSQDRKHDLALCCLNKYILTIKLQSLKVKNKNKFYQTNDKKSKMEMLNTRKSGFQENEYNITKKDGS